MRLNDDQKNAYLPSRGIRCPVCGSGKITAGPLHADADIAHADVTCEDCGAEWADRCALVGIEPREV